MASNLTKVARIATIVGTVGAISLAGVKYGSESPAIQSAINGLKEKALGWKNQAGLNKAELNKMTKQYNDLKANYDAVLKILKVDGKQNIDTIKQQVQEIYNNANNTDSTSIVATNNTLKSIAEALGVTLTDEDKVDGVYKTDKIMDKLTELDTKLDELETALGDLAINLESGDMEYSNDMTLTQKINYLIGQINKANDDQAQLKINAENANNAVGAVDPNYTVSKGEVNSSGGGEEPEIIPGESTPTEPEQPTKPTKPVDPPVDDNNNTETTKPVATALEQSVAKALKADGITSISNEGTTTYYGKTFYIVASCNDGNAVGNSLVADGYKYETDYVFIGGKLCVAKQFNVQAVNSLLAK